MTPQQVNTKVMLASGVESPIEDFDQDDLHRYPIVHRLFSTLTSVPRDSSVRIGLYGPWGHGKTSVLRLLRNFARSEGYFVVEYTPWSSTTPAQSLTLLFLAIVDECERRDIQLPGKQKKRILSLLEKYRPFWKGIAKTHAIGEIAVPLISLLFDEVFQADEKWYKTLREKVKDGRVLILIDDLDRASPELIPILLLALRDKVDLPGFSFLLAFDNTIVVKTIEVQYPAWKPGGKFIEKIIDIPFILPLSDVSQRVKLIKRAIPEQASEAIDSVKELLPETPRQLKLLARHVFALNNEVERHYPEELNWVSIVYCLMIRMESESFLQVLTEEIEEMFFGWVAVISDEGKQEEYISKAVKSICDRCAINEEEKKQRLTALVGALQTSTEWMAGNRLKYQAMFADQPHAITWKEYDDFFKHWSGSKRLMLVTEWTDKHASSVGRNSDSVYQEIFEATVNRREEILSTAADVDTDLEHANAAAGAQLYSELLYQLLIDGCGEAEFEVIHTEDNFSRVLKSFSRYFHFRNQPVDNKLREQEEKFLNEFVARQVLPVQVLNKVLFQFTRPGEAPHSSFTEFSTSLVSKLEPELFEIGLEEFLRVGAWREEDTEYNRGMRYALLRLSGENEDQRNRLATIIGEAKTNDTVHSNCLDFAKYLIGSIQSRRSMEVEKYAKELLLDNDFVAEVWASVTCKRLQFRAIDSISKIGDALLEITGATLKGL